LQENKTAHEDNIKLQKMLVNTLQTTLAAIDNPYSPHSTLQKSQETHLEKNKQILSLLKTHCEKIEEIEYHDAQKQQQIMNMIVVDVMRLSHRVLCYKTAGVCSPDCYVVINDIFAPNLSVAYSHG